MQEEQERTTHSLEAFEMEAARFARTIRSTRAGATLITLSGDLGAGKTAFVKAAAKELGVLASITSPTFTLQKEYILPEGALFKRLVHIDAYRLANGKDLEPLRMEETLNNPENLVMLEWPERVEETLPIPTVRVRITPSEDGSRHLVYA